MGRLKSYLLGDVLSCGDIEDWLQDATKNRVSYVEALQTFGPGWWAIVGKIYKLVGDHNWECWHGRADNPVRIERVYHTKGLLCLHLEPEGHALFGQVVELLGEAIEVCEECGREDPIWWGIDNEGDKINGRYRVLCESCAESIRAYLDVRTRIDEVLELAKSTPLFEVEPWFPGKDERDAEADGDEKEDWQK